MKEYEFGNVSVHSYRCPRMKADAIYIVKNGNVVKVVCPDYGDIHENDDESGRCAYYGLHSPCLLDEVMEVNGNKFMPMGPLGKAHLYREMREEGVHET